MVYGLELIPPPDVSYQINPVPDIRVQSADYSSINNETALFDANREFARQIDIASCSELVNIRRGLLDRLAKATSMEARSYFLKLMSFSDNKLDQCVSDTNKPTGQ